jgi:hypothetical protein
MMNTKFGFCRPGSRNSFENRGIPTDGRKSSQLCRGRAAFVVAVVLVLAGKTQGASRLDDREATIAIGGGIGATMAGLGKGVPALLGDVVDDGVVTIILFVHGDERGAEHVGARREDPGIAWIQ